MSRSRRRLRHGIKPRPDLRAKAPAAPPTPAEPTPGGRPRFPRPLVARRYVPLPGTGPAR